MAEITKKCAVVTGANKGIGLEICRQLASEGITVILTARDEQRGLAAVENLKGSSGISDDGVVFHQLDVTDLASVDSLAEFIKSRFGKLDILVNNAAILGAIVDGDAWRATIAAAAGGHIPNEWAKGILNDAENLTEGRIDEVVNVFLKDFEGSAEAKGWPQYSAAYIVSKAAVSAYTIILAKKYPSFRINCVCPGYVNTDFNYGTGMLSVEEGAESPVKLALIPDDGPSGMFFFRKEVSSFEE
ncbi:hypothetical protein ABFS83_02G159200 [Erythranthe nasuta]